MPIKTHPTEIQNQICGYLELSDWCAFRSTCSTVYTKCREAFAGRFFKSICMLVTRDSLKYLEEFAADEFIRIRLQELWIVPVLFEGEGNMSFATFRDTTHPNKYFEQYQAEVEDHRRILGSKNFQDTLTHCVARFENLSTIGLRSSTRAYRTPSRTPSHRDSSPRFLGLRNLQRRMSCYQGHRMLHMTRQYKTTVGRDHALVFSALLKAVAASNRPLKRIDTCNDFHLGYKAATLNLISIRESLIPVVRGLETLHLCQLAEEPEDSSLAIMHDILVEAAPSLKDLTYGQRCPGQNMSPCSFASLSQRVQFIRLRELHLCWVEITYSSFEAFLCTAAPTLRVLILKSIDLKDDLMSPLIPGGGPGDFKWTNTIEKEMAQAWRRVCNIIRDQLWLEYLSLHKLGFCGHRVTVRDALSHTSGRTSAVRSSGTIYDGLKASVTFHEWINNLQVDPSPRRGKDLPGTCT